MKKLISLQKVSCPVANCRFAEICLYGPESGTKTPDVDFSFGSSGLSIGFLYLVCQSYEIKRKPGRPKVLKEKKQKWVKILKNVPMK